MSSHPSPKSSNPERELKQFFVLSLMLFCEIFGILWYTYGQSRMWFKFGLAIGAIFVLIAFYYYYDNFLVPAFQDLKHGVEIDVSLMKSGLAGWLIPAILVNLFVVVGFWLTVSGGGLKHSMYTHPYMYGQQYKKLEGLIRPEIASSGILYRLKEKVGEGESLNVTRNLVSSFGALFRDRTASNIMAKKNPSAAEQAKIREFIIAGIYKIPFFIALTYGFLGTLMYTLNDVRYRFFISDLYPKTYVGYLIRFIFAPVMSMVIAYFFMNDWLTNLAPLLFFGVGFFPQMALQFIEGRVRKVFNLREEEKARIPLGLLQGMTDYITYRFRELGIEDAQNLAYADIGYLKKNWPNPRQLCDFIAQALLLIHMPEDFTHMQAAGVRNIITLQNIINPANLKQKSDKYAIHEERLEWILRLLDTEPLKSRIAAIKEMMDYHEFQEIKMIREAVALGRA